MQAIEFESYVENGVIVIPLQYQKTITHSVRVIVLSKDETFKFSQKTGNKKNIYSLAVDMSGFTFNRELINER
jgi:hypothetical protein